eukprot:scaffold4510_cov183-Amphora_coffeaeformis.AAC.41
MGELCTILCRLALSVFEQLLYHTGTIPLGRCWKMLWSSSCRTLAAFGIAIILACNLCWDSLMIGHTDLLGGGGVVATKRTLTRRNGTTKTTQTNSSSKNATVVIGSENVTNIPSSLSVSDRHFRFYHVGKAGGGTVLARLRLGWRIEEFRQCHPSPEKCFEPRQASSIAIGIRDPLDRFVSAFYWRTMVLCNPHGDKRKKSGLAANDPQKLCKPFTSPKEIQLLFHEYHNNATGFAEDLCSSNETRTAQLVQMANSLQHFQTHLGHWLNFTWKSENMFAIVAENAVNVSLEDETDAAVHWLYNRIKFESPEEFQNRGSREICPRKARDVWLSSCDRNMYCCEIKKRPCAKQAGVSGASSQCCPGGVFCLRHLNSSKVTAVSCNAHTDEIAKRGSIQEGDGRPGNAKSPGTGNHTAAAAVFIFNIVIYSLSCISLLHCGYCSIEAIVSYFKTQ